MVLVADGQVLDATHHLVAANSAQLYDTDSSTPPGLVSITITPANPTMVAGAAQQLIATGDGCAGADQRSDRQHSRIRGGCGAVNIG